MNYELKIKELERELLITSTLLKEEQQRFKERVEIFVLGMQDAKKQHEELKKEIKDLESTDAGLLFRIAEQLLWCHKDIRAIEHSTIFCTYAYDVANGTNPPRNCCCGIPALIKLIDLFGQRNYLQRKCFVCTCEVNHKKEANRDTLFGVKVVLCESCEKNPKGDRAITLI